MWALAGVVVGAVGVGFLVLGNRLASLPLRAFGVGIISFDVWCVVAQFAIDDWMQEWVRIPHESFRYRFGVWLASEAVVIAILALTCWPLVVAMQVFGMEPVAGGRAFLYLGVLVTGLTWVLLWDFVARWVKRA